MKKAFRQKALACHPDKNPDDPNAAELFRKYSRAAEILIDTEARKAYEKVLRARKEREIRSAKLDGERRKLKEKLEAREKAFNERKESTIDEALKLAREIERLRKEGCSALQKENEELKAQIKREMDGIRVKSKLSTTQSSESCEPAVDEEEAKVKISWKQKDVNPDAVKALFERFGTIKEFLLGSKGTSALLVYSSQNSAINAHNSPLTSGFTIKILNLNATACLKTALHRSTQLQPTVINSDYEGEVLAKLRKKAHLDSQVQQPAEHPPS